MDRASTSCDQVANLFSLRRKNEKKKALTDQVGEQIVEESMGGARRDRVGGSEAETCCLSRQS
jgi:hypothetical protein